MWDRLLIVLSCQVVKEAGQLEKIGNPVALDETMAAAATTAPPTGGTNMYAQGQQQQQHAPQQQQVQQARPSQYSPIFVYY